MHTIRRGGKRSIRPALTLAILVATAFAIPAVAQAANCTLADFDYNGACGPEFETPAWGDASGWTDPSQYTTIHLADLTGDGVDELIGRGDDGIEVWEFDTTVGQWRQAIGKDGDPEVLGDFRSPLPSESGPSWTQAPYYDTIQTADLDGPGHGADIIARFPDGIRVYAYTPPSNTKNIDGGTWSVVATKGPFSNAEGGYNPEVYQTIHVIEPVGNQPAELVSQGAAYKWTGSGWTKIGPTLAPYQTDARYYLDNQVGTLTTPSADIAGASIYRTPDGVAAQYYNGSKWVQLGPAPTSGNSCQNVPANCSPFADNVGLDCPSSGSNDCLGGSPSYYETLRLAELDRGSQNEFLLARLKDGLHGYFLDPTSGWGPIKTLTDLKGDPATMPPGQWSSIRTGDVEDTHSFEQVLALDGKGLQTWSYKGDANTWTKLDPAVPLSLGGDMWNNNASYYSTIQVGDVTGDGHAAVVARGPFGIRTWFYNLHGNGGWTSWLPQDVSSYPQFSGGQAAALDALNSQAQPLLPNGDNTVRAYLTDENAPSSESLVALESGILKFARCSGQAPYSMCTPPPGSSGFTAADWTAAVNETLLEIGRVKTVDAFFKTLTAVRQELFITRGAQLDAIAMQLHVEAAAGNETTIEPSEIVHTIISILGAIAGENPLGVGLEIAGNLAGQLASGSPTLTSEKFDTTYADLKDQFADAVTDTNKTLLVQSQDVRQSYGLVELIDQLTTGHGLWSNPDLGGLTSADAEGFALWVYKQLLPTEYQRFYITNCRVAEPVVECDQPAQGPGVINGGGSTTNFTSLGPPVKRCAQAGGEFACNYSKAVLPSDLASKVFGALSATCDYKPPNAHTIWTNDCNLGVNAQSSVDLFAGPPNGWNFTSHPGDPVDDVGNITGKAVTGRRGQVTLTGKVALAPRFHVGSGELVGNRVLYEPGGVGELVRSSSGAPVGAVPLAGGHGGVLGGAPGGGASARLRIKAANANHRTVLLTLQGVNLRTPAACEQLPVSDRLATPHVALESQLRLMDGHSAHTVTLTGVWRCIRDRNLSITKLATVAPKPLKLRRGLAVSMAGPRKVTAGRTVTYRIRVRNTRRGTDRLATSLWDVVIQRKLTRKRRGASALRSSIVRLRELRRGKSRTLRFRVRIPRQISGTVCISAVASADSARSASARVCPHVARRARRRGR